MSTLRLFGCAIGILGLLATFLIYRGARWNRSSFILLTILNLTLISITINPNLLNILRDALSLQKAYRGRIIALLIVSNIFLLFYIFFTKLKLDSIHLQFDRLVRKLGSGDMRIRPENLKPIMILIPAYNEAANLMEKLTHMTGLELGPGMSEALQRMKNGEDPEQIEED